MTGQALRGSTREAFVTKWPHGVALEDELPIRLDVSPADAFAAAGAVFFATFVLIHLLALDF